MSANVIRAAPGGGEKSDLKEGWEHLWSAIERGAGPNFTVILTVAAAILALAALLDWVWNRRKSNHHTHNGHGGGEGSGLGWKLMAAGILAIPAVFAPMILTIVDMVINTLASLGTDLVG